MCYLCSALTDSSVADGFSIGYDLTSLWVGDDSASGTGESLTSQQSTEEVALIQSESIEEIQPSQNEADDVEVKEEAVAAEQISFEEVTEVSGIFQEGRSFGAVWGDVNGDTLPDLWVNMHQDPGALYLNQGDGTFSDATSEIFLGRGAWGDTHGAAFADFDNDGDQDLLQLREFEGANFLFVNDGGKLEDRAEALGVARNTKVWGLWSAIWVDFNRDGLLDIIEPIDDGPSGTPDSLMKNQLYRQGDNGFEAIGREVGFDGRSKTMILSDVSGDGNLDIIAPNLDNGHSLTIYDTSSGIPEVITSTLIPDSTSTRGTRDLASADFNGDLLPDLYLTRTTSTPRIVQTSPQEIRADINSQRQEFRFDTSGEITIELWFSSFVAAEDVFIGSDGLSLTELAEDSGLELTFKSSRQFQFTLSPDDPWVEEISPLALENSGFFIGYDSSLQRWQIVTSGLKGGAIIQATESISELAGNFSPGEPKPLNDQLLINTNEGFVDKTEESGINSVLSLGFGVSAAAGDFDNDMDVDLYILSTGTAANQPNILYENQGDGTFIPVANAGGASGTTLGKGDSLAIADYDLDGFLDLLVTNGQYPPPLMDDGPVQLFRNQGNENNWLQIDLEGVTSNRDGIGAQVIATAGGKAQLREQSGGFHSGSQNQQRIHFGLAENTEVDELLIKWPSGIVQRLENVAANQLIRIREASPLVVEAEDFLDLDTYRVEDNPAASGGKVISLNGGQGKVGLALNQFTGTAGIYDIAVRYFDEQDGNAQLDFKINGVSAAAWKLDQELGSGFPLATTLTQQVITGVELNPGDLIAIEGSGNASEWARVDSLQFLPSTTDPDGSSEPRTRLDDFQAGGEGSNQLVGGEGSDLLVGRDGNDLLSGRGGDDLLNGGSGNDALLGGPGEDLLNGGSGNDTLFGGGEDSYDGGIGDDKADFSKFPRQVVADLETRLLTSNGRQESNELKGIEDLKGTALADRLSGDSQSNALSGGAGDDLLEGRAGKDFLGGGTGQDTLRGGLGSDRFVLRAGDGSDTVEDFQNRVDFFSLAEGLTFAELTISSRGSDTLIELNEESLAVVRGVSSSLITSADFVFA